MRDPERRTETQAEGEADSTQKARFRTRSRDSRITTWAKGRCSTTEPPRWPTSEAFINGVTKEDTGTGQSALLN